METQLGRRAAASPGVEVGERIDPNWVFLAQLQQLLASSHQNKAYHGSGCEIPLGSRERILARAGGGGGWNKREERGEQGQGTGTASPKRFWAGPWAWVPLCLCFQKACRTCLQGQHHSWACASHQLASWWGGKGMGKGPQTWVWHCMQGARRKSDCTGWEQLAAERHGLHGSKARRAAGCQTSTNPVSLKRPPPCPAGLH